MYCFLELLFFLGLRLSCKLLWEGEKGVREEMKSEHRLILLDNICPGVVILGDDVVSSLIWCLLRGLSLSAGFIAVCL